MLQPACTYRPHIWRPLTVTCTQFSRNKLYHWTLAQLWSSNAPKNFDWQHYYSVQYISPSLTILPDKYPTTPSKSVPRRVTCPWPANLGIDIFFCDFLWSCCNFILQVYHSRQAVNQVRAMASIILGSQWGECSSTTTRTVSLCSVSYWRIWHQNGGTFIWWLRMRAIFKINSPRVQETKAYVFAPGPNYLQSGMILTVYYIEG
jgi:hypothetical protein